MVKRRGEDGDDGTKEGPGRRFVAEVDESLGARKYEIVSRASTSISRWAVSWRRGSWPTNGVRVMFAIRMMRGRPSTVSWPSVSPGSDAIISARCSSARSSRVAVTTVRDQQVLERVGGLDLDGEHGEELVDLANPQRLEQHVLAAGEQPIEGRPRHPRLGGDVVDRDLLEAPALAARLGGVEDPSSVSASPSSETLRQKLSHRQRIRTHATPARTTSSPATQVASRCDDHSKTDRSSSVSASA